MSSTIRKLNADNSTDVSSWPIPNVEDDHKTEENQTTNALGKSAQWVFEPPEEVDAEELQPLTAEEIEAIRQSAYEEGFNQGKEEGFAAGYAEGKEQGHNEGKLQGIEEGKEEGFAAGEEDVKQLTAHWQTLIEQLHQPLAVADKQVCHELLNLVVSLSEAVVQQEIRTNSSILIDAITEGIKALPGQETEVEIHLHPDDIKLVTDAFGEAEVERQGWRLMPYPTLSPGSCEISNRTSQVDYQIKNRLKEVLEPFLQDAILRLSASDEE